MKASPADAATPVAELLEELDRLRFENESLRTFAYVAAHELSGPARRILMNLQLLEHDDTPEAAAARIDNVRATASQMTRLISDLLTITSLGSSDVATRHVELHPIIEEIASDATEPMSGATVTVEDLGCVQANELLIRRLFANIIDNAVKFSRPATPLDIHVSATREGNMNVVTIADNGIGIGTKDTEAIFEPLVRLHAKSRFPGSGLGLTLARRIARWHGGDVTAAPAESGVGTSVFVTLPVLEEPIDGGCQE